MKYDEEYIIKEYNKGRTQQDIATELGTYNTSIRRILLRNFIIPRSIRESSTRFVNHNFLMNNYYWLGLLAADGCVTNHSIVLQLQERDKYILEEYSKIGGEKLKVNRYWNKHYQMYEYYVKFKNLEIENYLKSLGIVEKKSKLLAYYGEINWDFIRGYFDGDGCVLWSNKLLRMNIVSGCQLILQQLQLFLIENSIFSTITYNPKSDIYSLNILRQKDLYRLYQLMYDKDSICLTRKKQKFGPLVEKFTKANTTNSGKPFPGNPELGASLEL